MELIECPYCETKVSWEKIEVTTGLCVWCYALSLCERDEENENVIEDVKE